MKLGVAYNVFNGEELLEASIKSIRCNADYVCIVLQNISNFGQPAHQDMLPLCHNLKNSGLVDDLFEYMPQPKAIAGINETTKRIMSLRMCKEAGCTHFLTMDTDEIYIPDQFKNAKQIIEEGEYDSSACPLLTYWKTPHYQMVPPEPYYVPFIYKIRDGVEFQYGYNQKFPVSADPTRCMEPGKFKRFERADIEMHHLSYVRNNIRSKFENSSARCNFNKEIENLITYFDSWEYPNKAAMAGTETSYWDIKEVEDIVDKVVKEYDKTLIKKL